MRQFPCFAKRFARPYLAVLGCLFASPFLFVGTDSRAQDTSPPTAAAEPFHPLPADALESARNEALASLKSLELRLARDPEPVRVGWQSFLLTDQIREQLTAEKLDVRVVRRILERLRSDKEGMEFPLALQLRHSFQRFLDFHEFVNDAQASEKTSVAIEETHKRIADYRVNPTPTDGAEIGRQIGLLRRRHQAPKLVESVDQGFNQSNLFIQASKKLVATGIEQDIDETSPLNDSVLGVRIAGTVRMTGRVSLAMLPNEENASLKLLLHGQANSSNVGWKGPVTVHSTGYTAITAEKLLTIDSSGLHGSPASAACATSSSIDGVDANCGLIQRLATKKAHKSKGQAEAVASSKAESRVESRVDEQAAEMLDKANDSFQKKFRKPLVRRDGFPRSLRIRSTEDRLLVDWLQRSDAQIAASSPAPPMSGQQDLEVRLHQSFVTNFSEAAIGGVTLTDEKLAQMLEDATGEVPEELRIDEDKDPWSITFSTSSPISATFADQTITLAIHGDRFTRSDTKLNTPMRITAIYRFEKTPTGSKLVRQGEVEVVYSSQKPGQRESTQQVAFKTFMRRKFDALFKSEIVSEGIKLPGRWEKGGKLQVRDMTTTREWLSASWDMTPIPESEKKSETVDKTAARLAPAAP